MKCEVCFHNCDLSEGQAGFCKARKCENGRIVPASYAHITSIALDPIEKKPLFHFHPGSLILSVGSYGCNLRCPFCQNHEISQEDLADRSIQTTPEEIVDKALELVPAGNIGIAFTYNEPLVGYEFVRDTAKLAKEHGLKTVVVTNGTASEKVLSELLPYVDAFNVDLKGFRPEILQSYGGDLETVKNFIEEAAKKSHVEVTSLIVPGKNDSIEDMEAQSRWLASIDPDIVLHITRYFPRWKEKEAPTSIETMKQLQKTAQKHLTNVCLGNV